LRDQRAGLGQAVDRTYRPDLDDARAVPEHGAHPGTPASATSCSRTPPMSGSFGSSTEIYLRTASRAAPGPSVVAALMTQVTSRIGIVPTFGTYAITPTCWRAWVATARPGVRRDHRRRSPAAPILQR
jgi:hypothetical protein